MVSNFSRRGAALAVVTLFLCACSSTNSGPNPSLSFGSAVDSNFIVGATQASNAEISAAQLAQAKSTNVDVLAFAKTMIAQHTQQEQALAPIAAALSNPAPGPTSLNPQQLQMAQMLQATPEPAFDALYINGEITGHTDNLNTNFNPEIAGGAAPTVVNYAKTYVPQVQMHLQMAQQIKAKYGF